MGDDTQDLRESQAEELAAVIAKTIEAQPDHSAETRARVFRKARTLPTGSDDDADESLVMERRMLVERAIAILEQRYAEPPVAEPVLPPVAPTEGIADVSMVEDPVDETVVTSEESAATSEAPIPVEKSALAPEPVDEPAPAGVKTPTAPSTPHRKAGLAAAAVLIVAAGAWMLWPSEPEPGEPTVVAQVPPTSLQPVPSPLSTSAPEAEDPPSPTPSAASDETVAGDAAQSSTTPKEARPLRDATSTEFAAPDRFDTGAPPVLDPKLTPESIAESKRRENDPPQATDIPAQTATPPVSEPAAPGAPPETVPESPATLPSVPTDPGAVPPSVDPTIPSTPTESPVSEPAIPIPETPTAPSEPIATPPVEAPAEEPTGEDPSTAASIPANAVVVEESGGDDPGKADVTWSTVELSPQDGAPVEPAVMARARMPDTGLELVLTIRRNTDDQVPASHVMEMVFRDFGDIEPDPVSEVGAIVFGDRPGAATEPLAAFPAKIEDDHFVVVLNRFPGVSTVNLDLMSKGEWLDFAIQRRSGRSQIISLQKGATGNATFSSVVDGWRSRG
jgi:hypothetical protein